MLCKMCASGNQREFPSEINIHPPSGLKEPDSPCVWAFPLLLICLNCGFAELTLEGRELRSLRENYGDDPTVAADQLRNVSGDRPE